VLSDPEFQFSEVEKLAEDAHVWYKQRKFQPSTSDKLTGYPTEGSWYN
jgi:catalase